eukprot:CAMPEP_0117776310 /NCGR_PEP_ID=MMETSP0947-20121206/27675_1 /TAXON_ID=44440 /ORGANISM="Chattonella subsalsa, Strain CCMP2191" /LENGTH=381 /DNA_ID=CAMNT_0005603219 /DNA_START=89 /DNA_END=1234 /DNA_ORIENTATION=+
MSNMISQQAMGGMSQQQQGLGVPANLQAQQQGLQTSSMGGRVNQIGLGPGSITPSTGGMMGDMMGGGGQQQQVGMGGMGGTQGITPPKPPTIPTSPVPTAPAAATDDDGAAPDAVPDAAPDAAPDADSNAAPNATPNAAPDVPADATNAAAGSVDAAASEEAAPLNNTGDAMEDFLGAFPCVRLRGLPFECSIEDVLQFFQGLSVQDVVIGMQGDRCSGTAVVLFKDAMSQAGAIQRNREHMGRRYIEVFQAARMDYYDAIYEKRKQGDDVPSTRRQNASRTMPQDPVDDSSKGVLKMRGLPFSANRADVLDFFRGYNVIPDSVAFVTGSDGRVTGEGFVAFYSEGDAAAAMDRNRNMMGSRYIELFISSPQEMQRQVDDY